MLVAGDAIEPKRAVGLGGLRLCGDGARDGSRPRAAIAGRRRDRSRVRQLWWLATAAATGAGLFALLRVESAVAKAPWRGLDRSRRISSARRKPAAPQSTVPAELAARFAAASLSVQAATWLLAGALVGAFLAEYVARNARRAMSEPRKFPATIVTGFLGAGKTTLIRHLLENAEDRRLALIINEFGDVGVDGDILRACGVENCPDENIVELANGCLCCTVADDFVPAIEALLAHEKRPDHIIIETSGLALPKPLVKAFDWPAIRSQADGGWRYRRRRRSAPWRRAFRRRSRSHRAGARADADHRPRQSA